MTQSLASTSALEQYLQSLHNVMARTVKNHRYRLNDFAQWFDKEADVDKLSSCNRRDSEKCNGWGENFDLNTVLAQYHVQLLRIFSCGCESIEPADRVLAKETLDQDYDA